MRLLNKKRLSILLAVAMMFSMNSFAAAEETGVEDAEFSIDAESTLDPEDGDDWYVDMDDWEDPESDGIFTYDSINRVISISNNTNIVSTEFEGNVDFRPLTVENPAGATFDSWEQGEGKVDISIWYPDIEEEGETYSTSITFKNNCGLTENDFDIDGFEELITRFSTNTNGDLIITFSYICEEEPDDDEDDDYFLQMPANELTQAEIEAGMSSNHIFGWKRISTSDGAKIDYCTYFPRFGTKMPKSGLDKVIGDMTISKDGIEYIPLKARIVEVKEKLPNKTVSFNDYIQITKLGISGNPSPTGDQKRVLRELQKNLKKATGASKKHAGLLPVNCYPFRLDNTTVKELGDVALKGKPGKETLSFKWSTGQGYKTKNGKKDRCKALTTLNVDRVNRILTINNNEMRGTVSFDNINVSGLKQ